MKVWLVWHYDYEQSDVVAAYDSESAADAHAEHDGKNCGVQEMDVRTVPPTWTPYFHGMAQVGCENPELDRAPFVERAGETDEWQPDPNERVSTCPGNWLLGADRSKGEAVWLSVFDMDRGRALARVTEKHQELLARREREGSVPQFSDLISEELATA